MNTYISYALSAAMDPTVDRDELARIITSLAYELSELRLKVYGKSRELRELLESQPLSENGKIPTVTGEM